MRRQRPGPTPDPRPAAASGCLSRPRGVLPPSRRVCLAWRGPPQAAAAPPTGRGGQSGRKEPEPSCHRVQAGAGARTGAEAGATAAGASRAQSPRGTPSSPPATSPRPPEPPRRPLTPEAAGPGPPWPSARPPCPAPAFTLERPRQPQQGRRRRIEELSRSSREKLLQSRDKMFSKFTSILQHAVEAVRPRGCERTTGRGWRRPTFPAAGPGQREPGGLGPAALGVPGPAKERGPGRALRGRRGAGGLGPGSERIPCSPSCSGPAWSPFSRSKRAGGSPREERPLPARIGGRPIPPMGPGESGSTWQGLGALPRTP